MREMIYLTGQIDSPFFTNEIGYFCNTFDKVHVLAYSDDRSKCDKIAAKYGFSYQFINTKKEIARTVIKLPSWNRRDYVIEEKETSCKGQTKSLKKKAYINLYGLYALSVEKIIKEHIRSGNEIFLYSFWLSRPAFAIASMNIFRDKSIIRIVSRVHRYDIYEEDNSIGYLPFRRFITENLDTIYFSSKDTYEYYHGKRYSDKKNQATCKLSYLGTNEPETKKEIKNTEQIIIASCANIIHRKRLDLIIQVIACLSSLGNKVKWIHIGDGELEEQIKKLAERTFEKTDVDYSFVGRLADEEIYRLYYKENVDFFINMSDSEGIPVSILEALSMGIPCIARDVGGNGDAIIDGYDGILVQKDAIDVQGIKVIAKRIEEIFANNSEYEKMSLNAVNHWDCVFCGKNNIQKICDDLINNDVVPSKQIAHILR